MSRLHMRVACWIALLTVLGCKSKEAPEPKDDRSFVFKKKQDPRPVTAAVRAVMPEIPKAKTMQALAEDRFGRGFEMQMCTSDSPDVAARAVDDAYGVIGWQLQLKQVVAINGWHIIGSNSTLVLSATTRGPMAGTKALCPGAQSTLIVINVRNPGRAAKGWARAAAKAGVTATSIAPPVVACPSGTTAGTPSPNASWCELPGGIKHGPFVWMEQAVVTMRGAYSNGLFHGSFAAHVAGKVVHKFQMTKGTGTMVLFHSAKIRRSEMRYRAGKKHGQWATWHANGKRRHVATYDNDWEQGVRQNWDNKGTKRHEAAMQQGRSHGVTRMWNAAGVLTREVHYKHGAQVKVVNIVNGKRTVATRALPKYVGTPVTTSHPKVKAAWQQCKRNDQCVTLDTRCCACGANDVVSVHYKFRSLARRAVLPPRACTNAKCPSMKCNSTGARCHKGVCVTIEPR